MQNKIKESEMVLFEHSIVTTLLLSFFGRWHFMNQIHINEWTPVPILGRFNRIAYTAKQ